MQTLSRTRPLVWRVSAGIHRRGRADARFLEAGEARERRMGRSQEPAEGTGETVGQISENKDNFPEGGASALERGAPSLADFKHWVGKAQA